MATTVLQPRFCSDGLATTDYTDCTDLGFRCASLCKVLAVIGEICEICG